MQALEESLAGARVRIAGMGEINGNAVTYNLLSEILSTISRLGNLGTPTLRDILGRRMRGNHHPLLSYSYLQHPADGEMLPCRRRDYGWI